MTYGKVAQLESCCRTELNGYSLTKVKLLSTYGCCAIDRFGAKNTFVWCLLTAQKYLYRMGLKENNPAEQDLAKAKNYFNKAKAIRQNYQEVKGYNNGLYHKTEKELNRYAKD